MLRRLFPRLLQLLLVATRTTQGVACLLLGLVYVPRRLLVSGARPRIAFHAYAAHLAQFHVPIMKRLIEDDRFDIYLVVEPHPHFSRDDRRRIQQLGSAIGLSASRMLPYWRTLWSVFDMTVHVDVFSVFPLRQTRRCLVAHGTTLPGRFFRAPWPCRDLFDFDAVFPAGAYDRDVIQEMSEASGRSTRVYAVGCPLLDRLVAPTMSRSEYLASLGLLRDLPVVLYAPHFSDLNKHRVDAEQCFRATVAALASEPVQVVLKPHSMSYVPAAVDGQRWDRIVRQAEGDRVRVDWSVDDSLALCHADVLITGRSSRAFNFMLLDKPVVLFPGAADEPDAVDNRRRAILREASQAAETIDQLVTRVREALQAPHTLSDIRRHHAATLFANPGRATDALANALYVELGVGAHVAARDTSLSIAQ